MDQTEKLIIDIIDQHRDEVIEFARDIYTHAELGYKEFRTSQKFVNKMKEFFVVIEDAHLYDIEVNDCLVQPMVRQARQSSTLFHSNLFSVKLAGCIHYCVVFK